MKSVIIFVCLIGVAFAAVAVSPKEVGVVSQISEVGPESYSYNVETSDGTHHDESGHLENAGSENEAIVVKGNYHYTDEKTGQVFSVDYTADASGFHPVGAHLPVVPAA